MLKITVWALLSLIGITLFIYINRLSIFQLKEINVSGSTIVPAEIITSEVDQNIKERKVLFGAIPYTNVFFIPEGRIESRLIERFPRLDRADVDISFGRVLHIEVYEKNMKAVWCTDQTEIICFDIDVNGNLYERVEGAPEAPYVYTGIIQATSTSEIVGKNFIAPHFIQKSESFITYLIGKGFTPQYIQCNTEFTCIAYIDPTSRKRIVFDLQSDLALVSERLNVALESDALKDRSFAYIDTRFGNKLFYKYNENETERDAGQLSKQGTTSTPQSADTATMSTGSAVTGQ